MYNFNPLCIRAEFYNPVTRIIKFTQPAYIWNNQHNNNGANIRHADDRCSHTHIQVCVCVFNFLYVQKLRTNCKQFEFVSNFHLLHLKSDAQVLLFSQL